MSFGEYEKKIKCPRRIITTITKDGNTTIVKKEFSDCLRNSCPYFVPRTYVPGYPDSIRSFEHCGKL